MVFSIKLSMCISLLDNAIISPLFYNAIVFYIFFNFSILHNLCGVLLCTMHNGVMQQGYVVYIIPPGVFLGFSQNTCSICFVLHISASKSFSHLRVQKFSPIFTFASKTSLVFSPRQLKIGKTFPLPQLTISKFILSGARTNLVFVLLLVVLHHYHQFHTNLLSYS